MSISAEHLASIKAAITEVKAEKFGFTSSPLAGDKEMVRKFPTVIGVTVAEVLEVMDQSITGDNYPTVRRWIVSPQCPMGQANAGTWRLAFNRYSVEEDAFLQTLRYGWAETVLTAGLPNDEARVAKQISEYPDVRSMVIQWHNIASTAIEACVASIRAEGSFTDPSIQGETKTGAWAVGDVQAQQADDGSYVITCATTKVVTIASITNLAALTPLQGYVRDIKNPFGLEGGFSVVGAARAKNESKALVYKALSVGSRDALEAMTEHDLLTLLPAPANGYYKVRQAKVDDDIAGTLKFQIAYEYIILATTTPEDDARYVNLVRNNQSGKLILTRSWPRIDPSVAGGLLIANDNDKVLTNTVENPKADKVTYSGDWLAKVTSAPETDGEGVRITQELIKAGDQSLDKIIGTDPDHLVYEFERWDITTEQIGEFLTETGSEKHDPVIYKWGTPEVGILKKVDTQKNADESFYLHAIYSDTKTTPGDEATALVHLELFTAGTGAPGKLRTQDAYYASTEKSWGWNIPVAVLKTYADYYNPTPKVVNQKNSFNISRQTEHVFDFQGVRETFVPIDSGDVIMEDDAYHTVTERIGKYLTGGTYFTAETGEFVRPSSVPANTKIELDVKDNEVGSKDAVKRTTVFKPYDDGGISSVDEKGRKVTRREWKYAPIAAVSNPGAAPIGTTYERSLKINDVKTFDMVLITTVSNVLSSTSTAHSGLLETRQTEVQVNADSEATAETATQNQADDVDNSPNQNGTFNTKKETTTKNPWDSGSAVVIEDDGLIQKKLKIFRNQTTPPTASLHEQVQLTDNGLGGYNANQIIEALSSSATYVTSHRSSVYDPDARSYSFKTPTWLTSTDRSKATQITGYNVWMASLWRYRTISTVITKSYSLQDPGVSSVTGASSGGSEGAGTSYWVDSMQLRENLWVTIEKTITTSEWSAFQRGKAIWMDWISAINGSGQS